MASRLISGLFLSGEVIDIDADTGGYNLRAAFATRYAAGEQASVPSASVIKRPDLTGIIFSATPDGNSCILYIW